VTTEIFLDAAAAAAPLLRVPALTQRWTQPSALAEFRISGLAGHFARAVLNVERYLGAPPPAEEPTLDAVSYFRTAGGPDVGDPSAETHRIIRERGEQDASGGPERLADRYDAARASLATRLPDLAEDQPVLMFGRYVLSLRECLVTRLVELVVHARRPGGQPRSTHADVQRRGGRLGDHDARPDIATAPRLAAGAADPGSV
jgi:hypothetical protein